jgi:ribonuclease HI/probable phosphoglycerate mutase
MPFLVMEALGMVCTQYYETGENIYAIDSRNVATYGEIKYLCACITVVPHITTIFRIIVVDLPPIYGVVMGRDLCSLIRGYIKNNGSCMVLPNKDGIMVRVPREARKPVSFRKKYNELMKDYNDDGIGNYVVLDLEHPNISKQEGENSFDVFWKMSFDGAYSKSGSGVGIVFKSAKLVIYPHAIKLDIPCTNNETEYEALIQGMNLSLQMKLENLIVTIDYELVINHIKNKYKIKKEKLEFYVKRANELKNPFSSINISFIPRDKSQKVDSLMIVTYLFNLDDSYNQNTF